MKAERKYYQLFFTSLRLTAIHKSLFVVDFMAVTVVGVAIVITTKDVLIASHTNAASAHLFSFNYLCEPEIT